MELNLETVTTPPRAAATVVLLRDAPAGLEVFLIKRHGLSDVLGGAYVFPGGKVDADRCRAGHGGPPGPAAGRAARRAGRARHCDADGRRSCMWRRCARPSRSRACCLRTGRRRAAGRQAAALLREGPRLSMPCWRSWPCAADTRSVLPWSRWITPACPRSATSVSTRVFSWPPCRRQQTARHDDYETTDSVWLSAAPGAAAVLGRADRAGAAADHEPGASGAARVGEQRAGRGAARRPPVIQPESFDDERRCA